VPLRPAGECLAELRVRASGSAPSLLSADDGSGARSVHAHAGSAGADAVGLGDLGIGRTATRKHERGGEGDQELACEPISFVFDVLGDSAAAVGPEDGCVELGAAPVE